VDANKEFHEVLKMIESLKNCVNCKWGIVGNSSSQIKCTKSSTIRDGKKCVAWAVKKYAVNGAVMK